MMSNTAGAELLHVNIQPGFCFHVWTQRDSQRITRRMRKPLAHQPILFGSAEMFKNRHTKRKKTLPRHEPEVGPLMLEEDFSGSASLTDKDRLT